MPNGPSYDARGNLLCVAQCCTFVVVVNGLSGGLDFSKALADRRKLIDEGNERVFFLVLVYFEIVPGIWTSLTWLTWWFGYRLEPIFTTAPTASRNDACFKSRQK